MPIHFISGLAAAAMTPGSFQDLDALDARITALVGASGTAVPIDRRIKLAACPEDPAISRIGTSAVSVRCPSLGWKIRVAAAQAQSVEVPTEPLIHRGDTIELVIEGEGYSATSVGTALDEGAAGGLIRVKIPTSVSPVSATVSRVGVATISD